jgi:hypothetical protein
MRRDGKMRAARTDGGDPMQTTESRLLMGILAWIILGLLVGLVAKVILHSDDPGGVILTPSSALSER